MAFTMSVAELIDADTSGMLGIHATWARVPLGDIATILNGAPFDSELFSTAGGMPLIRIRDITNGQTNTYYNGKYDDTYLVKQGDLLVGMDGDFHSSYWGPQAALLNQRVCKISPTESFYDKRLMSLALPGYLAAINANTPSVTVKHLSSKTIGEIGLPLPPRAEQTRIVAKLEELLSDLDAGVAELKAAQKKLAQYRQSLLKAAVEGALTAQWRTQNTPEETGAQLLARILSERRARWEAKQLDKFKEQGKPPPKDWQQKYPEPVQPDISNLPVLPQGWAWSSLDQLAQIGTGVTPLRSKVQYFEGGLIPWVTSGALNQELVKISSEMVTALAQKECRLDLYPVGTLLVAMYGEGKTRGKCSELGISATINQAIAALVLSGLAFRCQPYVKLFLLKSYEEMRTQASGGVQPNLNLQIVRSIPVPLPPLSEQSFMNVELIELLDAVRVQDLEIDYSLKQSTAQRQNILRAAFAGQLVSQDPADEPASLLLERIRTERTAQAAVRQPRGRKGKEAA